MFSEDWVRAEPANPCAEGDKRGLSDLRAALQSDFSLSGTQHFLPLIVSAYVDDLNVCVRD